MTSALVTGVDGFLGRYIARELACHGYRVTGVDRSVAPDRSDFDTTCSIVHRFSLPSDQFDEVLNDDRPDIIVHAAGPASVPRSIENPDADFHGNVGVLLGLLESIRRADVNTRLINLSSAAVYGNATEVPIPETAPPLPVSPYGFHKLVGEQLIEEYHERYELAVCSVRIFSAYGVGLRRQVLWDIARRVRDGVNVELFGTGEETRDFVHAGDVAIAIRIIAERASFEGEVYNVATGRETSIATLATMLIEAMDTNADITFSGDARSGDPFRMRADTRKIEQLGFVPNVTLEQGIKEYADWVTLSTVMS